MNWVREMLVAGADRALARLQALDPAAPALLGPLQGKVFHFEFTDLDLGVFLLPGGHRSRLLTRCEQPPTTALRGESRDFLTVLRADDAAAALVNSPLQLTGDSQALDALQRALRELEPDLEAVVARWLGDVPAHALGQGARQGLRWLQQAGSSLARQSREYWREESGQLVPREAWEAFAAEVDQCREDLDRLAARMARLHRRRSGSLPQ